jgi:hypothetical protein
MLKNENGGLHAGAPIALEPTVERGIYVGRLVKVISGISVTALVLCAFMVLLQLVYPTHRAKPSVQYGNLSLGFSSSAAMIRQLQTLERLPITMTAANKTYTLSLKDIGLTINTTSISNELSDYPLHQRLLPFSLFIAGRSTNAQQVVVEDQVKLQAFANQLTTENGTKATSGDIQWGTSGVQISSPRGGTSYEPESIVQYLALSAEKSLVNGAILPYQNDAAVDNSTQVSQIGQKIELLSDKGLTIRYRTQKFSVTLQEIQPKFSVVNTSDGTLALQAKAALPADITEQLANAVYKKPTRKMAGQELDIKKTNAALVAALESGKDELLLVTRTLPAQEIPLYPATSAGITALMQDWQKDYPDVQLAADFSELTSNKRHASLNSSKQYFTASLYKIMAAWWLTDAIEKGKLNPTKPLFAGRSAELCFEDIFIYSKNECPEAGVDYMGGWRALNDFVHAKGVTGTDTPDLYVASVDGMRQLMERLHKGSLYGTYTKKILGFMKQNVYRGGLHAGSAGEVADKVGFNPRGSVWHDVGIVYGPKSTYSLSVMTNSSSQHPAIADLARRISDTLNR